MLRMMQMQLFRTGLPGRCINSVTKFPDQINQIRCYSQLKNDIETWVNTLDEAQQKRIRFVQNELVLQGVESKQVPKLERLTKSDYEYILGLSQNQRHKYYTYLYKMHNSVGADVAKQDIRRRIREEKQALSEKSPNECDDGNKHIEYGLGKGALIPKIYNRTIDKWKNTRALWRMALGEPKLIFDLSYSHEMTVRENREAAKQLAYCFGVNRTHREPFTLHYCGINRSSALWSFLQRAIPTLGHKPLPLQIHDEQLHDVFPKEKLVLLTPDSPNILREYNPDDYYVISGIVDRGDKVPLTLAKAKQLDIRTARLPLESFRNCRINKTLTLDQMLSVMLEVKFSGDWNQAFRYVAARKFF